MRLSASEWLDRKDFVCGEVRKSVRLGDGSRISIQQSRYHYCDANSCEILYGSSTPKWMVKKDLYADICAYVPLKDLDIFVLSRGGIVSVVEH